MIACGSSSRALNEFQGDDVAQVLRLLARQAHINLAISDKVEAANLKVTMRLENKSPLDAIKIIARTKNLVVDQQEDVYTIKTPEEKQAEPTEAAAAGLDAAGALEGAAWPPRSSTEEETWWAP